MNCYKCGKEIEDDSRFCEFCGLNIKEYINNMKEVNENADSHTDINEEDKLEIDASEESKLDTEVTEESKLDTEVTEENKSDIEESLGSEDNLEVENYIGVKTFTVEETVEDLIIDNLDKRIDIDANYIDEFSNKVLDDKKYYEDENSTPENVEELFKAKELEVDYAKLLDASNEDNEDNEEESDEEEKGKKSPSGIIKKIIIAVIIINVLIGIGGVIYLRSANDPKKAVDTFIEALKNSDYDKLSDVAIPKDSSITLNETMGKALFNLYNNDINTKESIEKILNEELIRVKNGITSENKMVNLIKEKHGLYNTYKVGIEDYDIELNSSLANVKVSGLNNEVQIDEADSYTVVKDILLGKYDINAIATDNYGFEYNYKESLDLTSNKEVYLSFPYTSIDIYKPQFEVTGISVNGKAYSNLAFNNNVLNISPVPLNSEVKIECRAPWGEVLSSSYTTSNEDGYNHFTPEFKIGEETKIAILNKACEFYKNMYTFYNDKDIASLEAMNYRNNIYIINNFIDSIKNNQENKEKKYSYYSYSYNISNLAADKELRIENIASGEFNVYVEATVEETSVYYDSDGKIKENRGNTSKSNKGYFITVKNVDGNWLVTNLDGTYGGEKINQIYNYN